MLINVYYLTQESFKMLSKIHGFLRFLSEKTISNIGTNLASQIQTSGDTSKFAAFQPTTVRL